LYWERGFEPDRRSGQEIFGHRRQSHGFATDVTKRADVEALIQAPRRFRAALMCSSTTPFMPIAPIEALKVLMGPADCVNIKGFSMELPLHSPCKSRRAVTSSTWLPVFGIKMSPRRTVYCAARPRAALTEGLRMNCTPKISAAR